MVTDQLERRGITGPWVLGAFRTVPRHLFVPEIERAMAYEDCPVALMAGQTISQPYMVALMTEELLLTESPLKLLEVGTGSGYQAAILACLGHQVISIERIHELALFARQNLSSLPYGKNVTIVEGDGSLGYAAEAPYDRIIVTAAAPHVPDRLVKQLKVGGRLVIPCGPHTHQELVCLDRLSETKERRTHSIGCRFVPLIGEDAF